LQIVFLAWTLLLAVSLTFNWALYRLVSRIADSPGSVSVEEITSNNDRQQLIGFIIIGSMIATGVVFIIWMRRMYLNIQSFGMRTIHGVGWVTGGWLVPILNLWRPKQIVDEIWRTVTPPGESREVSRVLHFWWGFWVAAGVVGEIVSISMGDEVSGSGEALLYVALTTASLAAAVLAFWVVTLLTSRHERFVRGIFDSLDC